MLRLRRRPSAALALALLLGALGLQGCSPGVLTLTTVRQHEATIKDIRMWHAPERSRIVFDMDRRANVEAFDLRSPARVVLDFARVHVQGAIPPPDTTGQFIRQIRFGTHPDTTRLVFDIAQPVRYFIRMLPPSGSYQYRLVVDFYHRDAKVAADTLAATPTPAKPKPAKPKPRKPRKLGWKPLVLIDPGHGGEDPGAIGKRVYEKKVVLQIAKKLKAHIDKQPRLRAKLTRTGDYYIPLRKRTHIARNHDADLFISIHADAFKNKAARGASVYALSQRGASSETAKWLADRENAADLIGGVSLADKEAVLAEVLLDLSMSKTVSESISFGRSILAELKKIGRVHSKRVEQGGFVVLKSPDIPSILLETGYITNPGDEKLLLDKRHQNRLVSAVTAGIQDYVARNKSRYANR